MVLTIKIIDTRQIYVKFVKAKRGKIKEIFFWNAFVIRSHNMSVTFSISLIFILYSIHPQIFITALNFHKNFIYFLFFSHITIYIHVTCVILKLLEITYFLFFINLLVHSFISISIMNVLFYQIPEISNILQTSNNITI